MRSLALHTKIKMENRNEVRETYVYIQFQIVIVLHGRLLMYLDHILVRRVRRRLCDTRSGTCTRLELETARVWSRVLACAGEEDPVVEYD